MSASQPLPASAQTGRTVPIQAGGGAPSSNSAHKRLETLSPSVIKHLNQIFHNIDTTKTGLSKEEASRFLRETQHDSDPSSADTHPLSKDSNGFDDFLAYMASETSNALGAPKSHNLTYPLSNYYISSSHNTYLTGNQLYSESTSDAYRNVLLRGCRCLEIDVWDGDDSSSSDSSDSEKSQKESAYKTRLKSKLDKAKTKVGRSPRKPAPMPASGAPVATVPEEFSLPTPWTTSSSSNRAEPRVLHGYTLTKEVSFREVCHAIRDSAFVTSDLPIIVSLEVHAGIEQQEIMVEIMNHAWKGMLVDTQGFEAQDVDQLPSPDSLRHKILVKVKGTAPKIENNGTSEETRGDSKEPENTVQAVRTTSSTEDERAPGQQKKKKTKIIQSLSQFGIYTKSFHFKHFNQPGKSIMADALADRKTEAELPTHVFSLSEKKVADVHETDPKTLFEHNRQFMMRAYPSGMRVTSSNLEPTFLWRQGIQMVALNWQRWDRGMMLNEGMFAGEFGWVLKPEGFRGQKDKTTQIQRRSLSLTIEVLAAQQLPLPTGMEEKHAAKLRPYVKGSLHTGEPEVISKIAAGKDDGQEEAVKRRTKTRTGVNPDFEGEKLHFANIPNVVEELAFVR
ncbi:MAG: hypothetical protein Q9227_005386 [Pyrenula ochraceoflavens]